MGNALDKMMVGVVDPLMEVDRLVAVWGAQSQVVTNALLMVILQRMMRPKPPTMTMDDQQAFQSESEYMNKPHYLEELRPPQWARPEPGLSVVQARRAMLIAFQSDPAFRQSYVDNVACVLLDVFGGLMTDKATRDHAADLIMHKLFDD